MRALIFDCDGVLAETERDVHLPAFNQAFREFGVPVHWSDDEYAAKLRVAGGRERMATSVSPELAVALGGPTLHRPRSRRRARRGPARALRLLQRALDPLFWTRALGGCRTTRDTAATITTSGFELVSLVRGFHASSPLTITAAPYIIGIARRVEARSGASRI